MKTEAKAKVKAKAESGKTETKTIKMLFVNLIKKWGISVISILVGGVIIFYLLATFNVNTEKTMEDLIHNNMEEMNQTAIISLNNSFQDFSYLLEKEAAIFGMLKNPDDQQILARLVDFAGRQIFKNAAIITYDGKVYSSFRGIFQLEKNQKSPNLYRNGTVISQPRVFHDGTLVIDISTPVRLNGKDVGKLVVSVDSDYIAKMFTDDILQGDASLNLVTKDGVVISRISQRESVVASKTNIFDFYKSKNVKFTLNSIDQVQKDFANQKSSLAKYNYLGNSVCVLYMPFGINDWQMGIAVTDATLFAQSNAIKRNALNLTLGIMLIVIVVAIVIIFQRINEQKRIDALKNTYSIAIRKTNDLFYEADIDNDIFVDYSEHKDKLLWKDPPKNYSNALMQVADICAPESKEEFLATFLPQNIKIKIKEGISFINLEYKIIPDNHSVKWFSATFVPVDDGSGSTKLICMENDITEHVLNQERLKKSATLDGLTGLYNKVSTKNYIDGFFNNDGEHGEHAFVLIDIDYFKQINDTFGHAKGDKVLVEFADSLKLIFRKSDIVGRIGGDEFVILLKDFGSVALIESKMNQVRTAFRQEHFSENPAEANRKCIKTSASIGVAFYSRDGKNFDQLYQAADAAMYESKENGRDKYTFFNKML